MNDPKYGDAEVETLGKALVKAMERETAILTRLAQAEARVAVLTEECMAHRAYWCHRERGIGNLQELDALGWEFDKARAATGPLPAKEGGDA